MCTARYNKSVCVIKNVKKMQYQNAARKDVNTTPVMVIYKG